MAGGVALPQALQLISGVPLKKVGSVFMEKLSATKRLDGGALGGLMMSVLQNGDLSSVMQNPMAAITSAIQGQIPGLVSQLQSVSGLPPAGLIAALTGSSSLDAALTQFTAAGNNLAGRTNGGVGFFSMLGHESLVDMAGSALPASASMATVTAPLNSTAFLTSVNTRLPMVVNQVVAGTMSADDATTWVNTQTMTCGTIVAASAAALTYGQSVQVLVSAVSAVAGSLAVPPTFDDQGNRENGCPTKFQGVLSSIVQPQALAVMARAGAAQIAHTKHDPVDVAALTSLEG